MYGYVGQDPTNLVDPTGLKSCAQYWADYSRNHHSPIPLNCNAGHPGTGLAGVKQAFHVVMFVYHVGKCAVSLYKSGDASACNQF